MKIIIVGDGKVGNVLANQLSQEKHDVVIIDNDVKALQSTVDKIDIIGIKGNGASYEVLKEAGAGAADLLIAVTSTDEINILSCLIGKKAGAKHTIARIRTPEYVEQLPIIKDDLGLSMTINPELTAAGEISRLLRFPSAMKIDTFAKGKAEMLKLQVMPGNVLDGMRIMDMHKKIPTKVLIAAVERGNSVIIPSGAFEIKADDKVTIIATPENAVEFFHKAGIWEHRIKNIMIIGGSTMAYYLAKQLIPIGMHVKIIEADPVRCDELSEALPNVSIIQGDGSDRFLLKEEGLDETDAFITLTNMDEVNIILSMYAKSENVGKVITKVNKLEFSEVLAHMDIGTTVSTKTVTANTIVRYVRAMQNSMGSNVETLYKLLDGKAEALEFRVRDNHLITGMPLEKLKLKSNLLVGCIIRGNNAFIPSGRDTIENGDRVIIVTTNTQLNDLNDILR